MLCCALGLLYAPAAPFFNNGALLHWGHELSAFETETDLLDLTEDYTTTNLYSAVRVAVGGSVACTSCSSAARAGHRQ